MREAKFINESWVIYTSSGEPVYIEDTNGKIVCEFSPDERGENDYPDVEDMKIYGRILTQAPQMMRSILQNYAGEQWIHHMLRDIFKREFTYNDILELKSKLR